GERAFKPKRIADGQDLLPHLQTIGIAELQNLDLLFGLDFNQRQIVGAVGIERASEILCLIGKRHLNTATSGDHVKIRENEALGVDQEAGAQTAGRNGLIEKIAANGRAGDVDGSQPRGLVNIDVVLLIGGK